MALVDKHCKMNRMCQGYICKFDLHISCVKDDMLSKRNYRTSGYNKPIAVSYGGTGSS